MLAIQVSTRVTKWMEDPRGSSYRRRAMNKRSVLAVALVLLSSMGIAACGGGSGSPQPSAQQLEQAYQQGATFGDEMMFHFAANAGNPVTVSKTCSSGLVHEGITDPQLVAQFMDGCQAHF